MGKKIDFPSLALGILLSVVVTGVYDTLFYFFTKQTLEQYGSLYATLGSLTLLFILVYALGFFKKQNDEFSGERHQSKKELRFALRFLRVELKTQQSTRTAMNMNTKNHRTHSRSSTNSLHNLWA